MATRERFEKTFNTSRLNLLFVVIFTSVNVLLTITNSDFHLLFSASIPILLFYTGLEFYELYGNPSFYTIGIIAAFVAIFFYALCWLLSKNRGGWIVVALVYFSIDVLILVGLAFSVAGGISFNMIVEMAFFAWIFYYLISGTRAWYNLKNMPPHDDSEQGQVLQGQFFDETVSEANLGQMVSENTVKLSKTIPIAQIPSTIAIRIQNEKKGRILISQNYNNMEILVKRAFGVTELIVNGRVYAEKTGIIEHSYVLEVNVNNTIINLTMESPPWKVAIEKEALPTMYLYVNGNLLAEKVRYY